MKDFSEAETTQGKAFSFLDEAYAQHSGGLTALKVEPIYDSLRSDPRFQLLLHRIRLDQ